MNYNSILHDTCMEMIADACNHHYIGIGNVLLSREGGILLALLGGFCLISRIETCGERVRRQYLSIRVNGSLQPRKLTCNLKMSNWNRNVISYPNNPFGGFQVSFSMRSQDRLCPELLWLSPWPTQNPKQKVFSRHESSQGRHNCDLTRGINI